MLSEKVKNYLIENGMYDDTEDEAYKKVMSDLGINLETPFAQFNLYTNENNIFWQSCRVI